MCKKKRKLWTVWEYVMSQGSGTAAHQLTDIFQSEDLFIMHLNGVVNRKVMFLKNGKIDHM